jgi:hypothetical protein
VIFSKTIDLVLSGRKTQTLRLAYAGDYLGETDDGRAAVYTESNRPRWIVGNTYAVQPERCHFSDGRIRVTNLFEVLDPLAVDELFAHREGFDRRDEFLRIWHELHKREPVQRCWAIGFRLVERDGVRIPEPVSPVTAGGAR